MLTLLCEGCGCQQLLQLPGGQCWSSGLLSGSIPVRRVNGEAGSWTGNSGPAYSCHISIRLRETREPLKDHNMSPRPPAAVLLPPPTPSRRQWRTKALHHPPEPRRRRRLVARSHLARRATQANMLTETLPSCRSTGPLPSSTSSYSR